MKYGARLRDLGLETLEERRHQADMHMTHKTMHGDCGLDQDHWLDIAVAGERKCNRPPQYQTEQWPPGVEEGTFFRSETSGTKFHRKRKTLSKKLQSCLLETQRRSDVPCKLMMRG
jgi:hypothetical protein